MAWFEDDAGKRYYIFGEGGGVKEAERLGVPLLGRIPIDMETRERGDNGAPVALVSPATSTVSAAFHDIAAKLRAEVSAT